MKIKKTGNDASDSLYARLNRIAARLIQTRRGDSRDLNTARNDLEGLISDAPERVKPVLEDLHAEMAGFGNHPERDVSALLIRAEGLFHRAFTLLEEKDRKPDPTPGSDDAFPARKPPFPPKTAATDDLAGDPIIVQDFVIECKEYLNLAEQSLLQLEKNPNDAENIEAAMRAFHTIKGSSAFLEMDTINRLAHTVESVLARIRDGEMPYSSECGTRLLGSVDVLSDIIQLLISGGAADKPSSYEPLMADLTGLAQGKTGGVARSPENNSEPAVPSAEAIAGGRENRKEAVEQSMTRVQTRRLDRLIDMVGELVIAHSMVNQDPLVNQPENHELSKKVGQSGKIIRELHDLSMSMRMIPLKATFQRMNRLVRDLAVKSEKPVRFETEGEETEIDRNMVDVLNEPLIHLLRNAIDHGLETPDERVAMGKPAIGRIRLKATHEGGCVALEVSDDGRGLDRVKIAHRAAERGLAPKDMEWTDAEIVDLTFRTGFSTSERLTDVSGRGIGMDAVRRGVESLKGRIDVRTRGGEGCVFLIRLPLTLAVTEGMLVRVGHERYVVPTMSIHVSIRPNPDGLFYLAGKGEMVLFQNQTIPVFRLYRLFGIRDAVEDILRSSLIIVGNNDGRYALMVDEIMGKQQVVEKGLGRALGHVAGIAGGAILGDGQVGLILDVAGLVHARETGPSGA
jgi:two-component system, chemotaxis family, sensor kinase CheA